MKTRIALSLVAGLACTVNADVIINHLPTDTQNGLVSHEVVGLEARSADDFTLPIGNGNAWNVTKLSGVLFSFDPQIPSSGKFEIYADGGGMPTGSPLYTFGADAAKKVGNNFGIDLVQFDVGDGVNTLFSASAGTKLWLSTIGTSTQNFAYFATYNFGGSIDGSPGQFIGPGFGVFNWTDASSQFGVQSDFAFAVEGRQVPAPAAAALLGLSGLVAGRRRRA